MSYSARTAFAGSNCRVLFVPERTGSCEASRARTVLYASYRPCTALRPCIISTRPQWLDGDTVEVDTSKSLHTRAQSNQSHSGLPHHQTGTTLHGITAILLSSALPASRKRSFRERLGLFHARIVCSVRSYFLPVYFHRILNIEL